MTELIPISEPAVEPVTAEEAFIQLGLGVPSSNPQLAQQVQGLVAAAREYCENITRTQYITRTWLYQRDGWPGVDGRYHGGGFTHSSFELPVPPFQSIGYVQYVDFDGNVQALTQSTDYGSNPNDPIYGYQLDPGSGIRAARLLPPWAKPWPPTRAVANSVQVQFKSGYGGPVTGSMTAGSAILTGPVFNPGDVGQAVSVPAAGANGAPLVTTIASVNGAGQATLAAAAVGNSATRQNNIWVGQQVPNNIRLAIKFMTQVFFEQGAMTDTPVPRVIADLLSRYMNRVS